MSLLRTFTTAVPTVAQPSLSVGSEAHPAVSATTTATLDTIIRRQPTPFIMTAATTKSRVPVPAATFVPPLREWPVRGLDVENRGGRTIVT